MSSDQRGYSKKAGEALFARKARLGAEKSAALTEYDLQSSLVDQNTQRLKALRLAKAEADRELVALVPPVAPRARKRAAAKA